MSEEAKERLRQFPNDGGNWERKPVHFCSSRIINSLNVLRARANTDLYYKIERLKTLANENHHAN